VLPTVYAHSVPIAHSTCVRLILDIDELSLFRQMHKYAGGQGVPANDYEQSNVCCEHDFERMMLRIRWMRASDEPRTSSFRKLLREICSLSCFPTTQSYLNTIVESDDAHLSQMYRHNAHPNEMVVPLHLA
jgi:hypothetical protein